jgi:membrane-associated phospholipid phosphatase
MTATLRVRAGQHFPSDAVVGGLIGTASGVLVPLVHDYVDPEGRKVAGPSSRAWWQAIAAELGGIGLGVLAAQLY